MTQQKQTNEEVHSTAADSASEGERGLSLLSDRATWSIFVSLLVFAILWQLASFFTPVYIIPGWEDIGAALLSLDYSYVWITTLRVVVALIVSFFVGVLLSVVMYSWKPVEDYISPMLKLLMAVPVISWILFAVLWFSLVEVRIAFVLVVVCAPIFAVDLLDGMKTVPKDLRDMVNAFRPTRFEFFSKLVIPAITPTILTSWKVNLSLAIRVVTIAELVGAVSGIGYGLTQAKSLFSVAEVFAWTAILVVILFGGMQIISVWENRLLKWRE